MSWNTALSDLRSLLADTDTDKKGTNKKLVGAIDGDNTIFFTYDKNIVEDTLEVLLDGAGVSYTLLDATAGKIQLSQAPDKNTKLVANYYFQWWQDGRLTEFLNLGAQACSLFDPSTTEASFTLAQPGMRDPVLFFAAAHANKSLVQYLMNRRHAEEFLIQQDGNDDSNFNGMIKALQSQAKTYWDDAVKIRDDFWQRQGRRNKPSFAVMTVNVRKYGPNQ